MAWDSDADIAGVFAEFGYTPTEAEISALRPSFGEGFGGAVATSAVAQYVNFKQSEATREANDPLNAIQTRTNNIIDQNTASVKLLSQQLQDTLSSAPQLFGSLTPDQISTYLKPLQTSFDQQMSQVQGTLAARGLGASSTEANALAQTNQQFQDTVLSTGLSMGVTAQQNKANAIQAQINNLFQQTGQALGIGSNAASQKSAQELSQSNLIASLPSFLNSQSAQMAAFNKAFNPDKGGFQALFNQVTGDINTGINTVGNIGTFGKNISTPFGGVSSTTPPNTAPGSAPSTSLYQGSPGTSSAYGLDPRQNALFQTTGSTFGS